MKTNMRIITIALVGLLVISIVGCDRDTDGDTVVDIPDATLRAEIAEKLEIQDDTSITADDMLKLIDFKITKDEDVEETAQHIVSLTGLEYATNLEGLGLSDNAIVDVAPLKGLTNLEWLNLEDNPLSAASIEIHIPAMFANGTVVVLE